MKDNTGWDFRMRQTGRWSYYGVAALTGFSFKKMYGRFVGTKKFSRNNKATILTAVSRGSTIRAN